VIEKALAFIFYVGTATIGAFILLFVFLVFYLLTLAIMSVVYLLQ